MDKDFVFQTASTILQQIQATTDRNVIFSWCFNNPGFTTINNMAALTFKVNGFDFKGRIWVAYNEGKDLYQIFGMKKLQPAYTLLRDDVYCDELGSILDTIIETGKKGKKYYSKTA